MRCVDCGMRLAPCPARFDDEDTYVGYYACQCNEAREEAEQRAEWFAISGSEGDTNRGKEGTDRG
jgi:hypothetical protein